MNIYTSRYSTREACFTSHDTDDVHDRRSQLRAAIHLQIQLRKKQLLIFFNHLSPTVKRTKLRKNDGFHLIII